MQPLPFKQAQTGLFLQLVFLLCCLIECLLDSVALDFPGTVSCHDDKIQIWLPKEFENSTTWQIEMLDASGEEIHECQYAVDYKKQTVMTVYGNCTNLEKDNNKRHLRFRLQFNSTVTQDLKDDIYDIDCDAVPADEASVSRRFTSATNCTKDFMAVTFPRLIPSFHDEYANAGSRIEWIVSIDDGTQTHSLSLRQAIQQGYTFLMDGNHIIFRVPFDAMGVVTYKQDGYVLYTVALKLTYGPPEQRLTVESRMICAPGPATCNSTHMTITIPAFPGILTAVILDDKDIPLNQFQANGIGVDTRRGLQVFISKKDLKSRLYRDGDCSGLQSYTSSLKMKFDYYGEMATMITYPKCPCEQNAPIAAVCTQDGHMEFDILSNSTKPALNLDTLKLKDPACGPVFRSPSSNIVQFRVPLNGCGTKQRLEGEKVIYENEVTALWADLPPRWISRDSEFRLTVMCTYSSDDVSLNIRMSSHPPPESVVNQGPLSLILLIYPDDSYLYPYSDNQYPIVKYLQQPIFLEVQVLNRNDPNIHLMLDDCWATLSVDPSSLPRWNIVVDGCDYELDNYKTVFHPVGPAVSFSNFRQRFEVKAFAFVSDGKALPSLVYFHCSVIICDRLHPDSPLCSTRCPLPSRSRRDVAPPENAAIVTLPHAVILIPEEQLDIKGPQKWSNGTWVTATLVAAGTISLLATALAGIACLKIQKKRTVLVN
ncbi:zona pellucida sperm-binding protein 2 [Sceloporus undulatus]|uniref:zona pellucida sperm-binding protein 2 n=1 Tax=Sceloporus undulatus TaxID=8520 RepID=UPI001C4BDFF3|nr:zona pellucida sperm-binding protein 2 [Sceloporus undulatus]